MVYYKYKKEKLEEKFIQSKLFLVNIRECINRNKNHEDDIINEAMVSFFNSFCEFVIDMCEIYLIISNNYIPNKSGSDIIELAGKFGFIEENDSKKLQNIIRLTNRYTHDYYERKQARERIIQLCYTELKTFDLFLEVSEDKIRLQLYTKKEG